MLKNFGKKIPKEDKIIILTAREKKFKKSTIDFLKKNKIKYDQIIFELNVGREF